MTLQPGEPERHYYGNENSLDDLRGGGGGGGGGGRKTTVISTEITKGRRWGAEQKISTKFAIVIAILCVI